TPASAPHLKPFLEQYRPDRVVPVGSFTAAAADRERRLGVKFAPALAWKPGQPDRLWDTLFPQAERAVVCPAQPRSLLLHAACLAGAAQAPLVIVKGQDSESEAVRRRLAAWKTREVFAIGDTAKLLAELRDVKLTRLTDEPAVSAA